MLWTNWAIFEYSDRLLEVLAADIAMTALSWLLIAGVPVVPLVAWGLVLVILGRESGVAGLIPVFLMSVLFSVVCQSALLRCFKHKVAMSEFWLLAGINLFCLLLAFYRMYVFAVAHPPEASGSQRHPSIRTSGRKVGKPPSALAAR
jgi:hypothetical protein